MTVKKAASAGLWSTVDIGLRQGVGFVVSIILARLLVPADFGIIALLTFFSSLSIVFVQGGLSVALIQRQETSREEESAVFWWNLAASLVFAATLITLAPVIAAFYGYPILAVLMPFAAGQIVFSALGAVQTALLTRAFRFNRLAMAGVISSFVSGGLGVGAAYWGAGVWALALQMISLAAVNSAMLWWASDWRPSLHFRFATITKLFRFGLFLSLSSTLDVLSAQGFALVIGKLHGVRDLGLYNRANGTQLLPSGILSTVIARVALPLFSARADDTEALRRGVRMSIRLIMLLNFPMMAGLAVLADLVILVLFGEKWLPAAPILTILAFSGLFVPLHVVNLQLLVAQGRSDRFFKVELAKKPFSIGCVLVGSFFGIEGLAYSVVAADMISFALNTYYSRISIGYGASAQLKDVGGAAAISLLMAGVVHSARPLLDLPPIFELAALVAIGAAVYVILAAALVKYRWSDIHIPIAALMRRPNPEPAP